VVIAGAKRSLMKDRVEGKLEERGIGDRKDMILFALRVGTEALLVKAKDKNDMN
jgi:hypothetical protein